MRRRRSGWTLVGALIVAMLTSGVAQADGYSFSGTVETITSGDDSWTAFFQAGPPQGPCWNHGDTIFFQNTESSVNAGTTPHDYTYTIELFEWVGGSRGSSIDGPYQTTHTGVSNRPGQNMVTTQALSVSGIYLSWNGNPGCALSFEVLRSSSMDGQTPTWNSVYY